MSRTYISDRARFETENIDRSMLASMKWKPRYGQLLEPQHLRHAPVIFRQAAPLNPPRCKSPPRVALPPPTPPTLKVTVAPSRRHFNMSPNVAVQREDFYKAHIGRPASVPNRSYSSIR